MLRWNAKLADYFNKFIWGFGERKTFTFLYYYLLLGYSNYDKSDKIMKEGRRVLTFLKDLQIFLNLCYLNSDCQFECACYVQIFIAHSLGANNDFKC